eukprot:Hpha_TRINITY_DN16107_c1_g19::TRINITY_DN16107_c1_g19_i1::g.4049::m.4049
MMRNYALWTNGGVVLCAVCQDQARLLLFTQEELEREQLRCAEIGTIASIAAVFHTNALVIQRRVTGKEGRTYQGAWQMLEITEGKNPRRAVEFTDDDDDAVRIVTDPSQPGSALLVINGTSRGRPKKARWNPRRETLHCPPWKVPIRKSRVPLPQVLGSLASLLTANSVPHNIEGYSAPGWEWGGGEGG